MVTPFLKPMNTEGGTLYVFPSVSKDLTRTFVSNDYEFKFSHFACLNLPDLYSGKFEEGMERGLYLESLLKDQADNAWSSESIANRITEYLQNYVMNFEVGILNGEGDNDDYDNSIMTTVSEKVFFNWLQKIGGIQFNDNTESYGVLADRTVQYIGDIDVMNTVEINGDTFEELYIHIPSTVGASSVVRFRYGYETDNKNYLNKNYLFGSDAEHFIFGRTKGQNESGAYESFEHPYGLSVDPIIDGDQGTNMYKGDPGYTIDFRNSSYAGGDGIMTMNGSSSDDFEFNAVLIYYDFCEKTSDVTVKKVSTNLYGILFLDQPFDINSNGDDNEKTDSTDNVNNPEKQGYFQRYPKMKETVYGNGNSFALKIDLKIDTTPDYTDYAVTKFDDPNGSPISMSMYEKALVQMQKCVDIFVAHSIELARISERVANLETMTMGIDTVETLRSEIDRLYNLYDGNAYVDTERLLGLINVNSKKLDAIMNGNTDVKVQFDTDVIQPGLGVSIRKSPNKVVIDSESKYSINGVYYDTLMEEVNTDENPIETGSTSKKDLYVPLKYGDNLAVIYMRDTGDMTTDVNVFIDDTECNWKVGQSMKVVLKSEGAVNFKNGITNGFSFKMGSETINISGDEITEKSVIEIICVGDGKFIHLIK